MNTTPRLTDALGVEVRIGDTATITAWGAPIRLTDTGRTVAIIGITPGNLRVLDTPPNEDDPTARGRAISPGCVAVARRDGEPGHEGNAR